MYLRRPLLGKNENKGKYDCQCLESSEPGRKQSPKVEKISHCMEKISQGMKKSPIVGKISHGREKSPW